MAVKTFTTGEVLTAADTNTYLNNGGLVYITSQTIGTAVSSVTVSNVFSATFDNYLVQINGGASSTEDNGRLVLGGATSGYYGNVMHASYASGGTFLGTSDNNAAQFSYAWRSHSVLGQCCNIELMNPNRASATYVRGLWVAGTATGQYTGVQSSSTQFTAFTLSPATGTMTGGTITVYGYRKA